MNRNEIIQKSVEIANKKGLKNLTATEIAKSFNVKPPSLYKHIKNINEIYDELGIICISNLVYFIQSRSFGLSGDAALKEFCLSSRSFALQNPGLYESMQMTHVKRSQGYQKKAEELMTMLGKLLKQYRIEKKNMVDAMRHLRCLLHGFIDLEFKEGFGLKENADKSFEIAVNSFIFILKNYNHINKGRK